MFVQCFEVVRHRVSAKYPATALHSYFPIMKEFDATALSIKRLWMD